MKVPKLTCMISGQSRVTSYNYLKQKADRLGKSVDWLLSNYVAKNVCSKLRKGTPVSKITDNEIVDSRLVELVQNNSKCREAFTFVDGVYTPDKAKPAPKAPRIMKTVEETDAYVVKTVSLESMVEKVADKLASAKSEWCPEKETTVPAKTSDEVLTEMVSENDPF